MQEELIPKIKEAEARARILEPRSNIRREWMKALEKYSERFLDKLGTGPAYRGPSAPGEVLKEEAGITEDGTGFNELIDTIEAGIDRDGINPASGGHLGYIPGGGIFPAALGDFIAAISNRYAGIWFANPGAVELENLLIRWMCDLIGYPESALGNLASGGSIANLIAIVSARDAKNIGSQEVDSSVIYLTEQAHHSIEKAIRIAGLGEAIIRYLPLDKSYRMRVDAFRESVERDKSRGLKPFLVISAIGTTDTGAVDPSEQIAEISEKNNIWFHIDAAYGGFFVLSSLVKEKFTGWERSDSVTIDPHKGLFLPYGTGAVLIKDVEACRRSHYYHANYMQDAKAAPSIYNPADLSPELSKHFRALRMWLPLKLFGLSAFRAALDEKILLCRYFYKRIREEGFETGPAPELSVCIYRHVPVEGNANKFNERLVRQIQNDGRVFISSTTIHNIYWLRIAILNFRTHLDTIDLALEVICTSRDRLADAEPN